MTQPASKPTLRSFDGCRVVEQLASGPLTELYRAEQTSLGRPVLIKVLSETVLPTSPFAATLEREARVVAELEHENILRLYDFVQREDTMWLVLEHVDGYTLAEVIQYCKKLPARAAAAITLQLARALEHAHAAGVVHRDVRPDNVLVSRRGRVKLAHFAVASAHRLPTAPELLEADSGFGQPSYMSPEQVLGEAPDPRSDLFSLGVVLYEMLTGTRPFDAPDHRAATQRIRHDPPPPLSRSHVDAPAALERLMQRCLQKMPSDRFFSASELIVALDDSLQDDAHRAEAVVTEELARCGLNMSAPHTADAPRTRKPRRGATVATAARGYVVMLAVFLAGAAALEILVARRQGDQPRSGGTRLELVPPRAGKLRVVAEPWAHVIVDGQRVATTPFAHPVPLPAGTHYVRLEHPKAPTERRTVTLAPGETVLLDVKMDVVRPPPPKKELPLPEQVSDPETP